MFVGLKNVMGFIFMQVHYVLHFLELQLDSSLFFGTLLLCLWYFVDSLCTSVDGTSLAIQQQAEICDRTFVCFVFFCLYSGQQCTAYGGEGA